jgi:endonuclease/exonuclease/phosphatase family metal-dependent hydrolase
MEPRSQLNAGYGVAVDTLRILSYNIHHGEGLDGELDLDRIAALVNKLHPDLVALQEVDQSVERTGKVNQADILGELTGMEPVFGAFMDYQGGQYGMAVLSRWLILTQENIRLPDGDEPRSSVTIRARSPETGQDVVFSDVHFYRTEEERLAQAQTLVEALEYEEAPVIVAGDFNSQPGTAVMQWLSTDWNVLTKEGGNFTFPADGPEREIDYVMYRTNPRIQVLKHIVLDETVASDHRPIYAELLVRSLPPAGENN